MKSTETTHYKYFINEIVRIRKELKLTQAELASQLGKPQSYVAKIENFERRIDIAELIEIGSRLKFEIVLKRTK